jgi:purine nucleoside phosphorylase
MTDGAEIGVFGGSGLYALLDDVIEVIVDTPYGPDGFFDHELDRRLVDDGVEGVDGLEAVTQEEVFAFFERNVDKVRGLLFRAVDTVPTERACACASGPNGMTPPPPLL